MLAGAGILLAGTGPWVGQAAAAGAGDGAIPPGAGGVAGQAAGTKEVAYRGYSFRVPAGWPVIDLAARPATCVRFDRHAVYLGKPGANQSCRVTMGAVTEALLVRPSAARPAEASSVDDLSDRLIKVVTRRITVTASYRNDRAQVLSVLASAGLRRPGGVVPGGPLFRPRALPASAASYRGKGFDTCTVPSARTMHAWRARSPYRAIGIYIGGSERACDQPNLTPSWLRRRAAEGWHFLPLYVGPQFAFGDISAPVRQANNAAWNAAVRAESLGLRPGTPLYYDMEAYSPNSTGRALTFFTSWTRKLHALGYRSGIYSSSLSGVADLARNYRNHRYLMPDVIYDAWWNGRAGTADPRLPPGSWRPHRRIHQYSGNVIRTYGAVRLNIDQDFLNVRLRPLPARRIRGHWTVAPGGLRFAELAVLDGVTWHALHNRALPRDFRLTRKYLGRNVPKRTRYWVPAHRRTIKGHWATASGGKRFAELALLDGVTWKMMHNRALPGDFRLTKKYRGKRVPRGTRYWVPAH
ncbi:MAG: DUF1906 domain-containing protein [Actinobacteria bacterium]|nr:DUF1906 domain-containing protein [Actinomycetota bacterium]MBO0784430.1 DUF1906 domain-containing protein [Actinomycetota bacterium]